VIFIDYPGFNLRFAAKLHAHGIRTIYYVSPQVWAWGKRRIPRIARVVDKMLVIFPFESAVFAGTGLDVEFVGHPLIEILEDVRTPGLTRQRNTVVLLPGSRTAEIERLLPPIFDTACWLAARHEGLRFVLPLPAQRLFDRAGEILQVLKSRRPQAPDIELMLGKTREWLQCGEVGLAASGTVTVESAILGLPLVVVYRVSPLTYWLARMLVNIPYFAMVNVVAGRRVFDEFLQGDVRPEILGPAVEAIMVDGPRRDDVIQGMGDCVAALGRGENVCENAARAVLEVIRHPGEVAV
jgi:lipid-A-disaccharide synthase